MSKLFRWKVTLHDYRKDGPGVVSYEMAHKITAASARVWSTIPRGEHHHYTITVERAPEVAEVTP